MSSTPKEPKPTTAKSAENSEMEVDDAVANKSIETTDKSDAPNTSSTSVDKNVAKKKKIKSSSSNQSHKKMKKDPNKPEYPKVGMCRIGILVFCKNTPFFEFLLNEINL